MPDTRWGHQPVLAILRSRGLRHTEVAAAVGRGYHSFSFQVRGYTYPAPELRHALSRFLGVPESELFTPEVLASPQPRVGRKPRADLR